MSSDEKFADHDGYAQHEHAAQVYQDESGTAVVARFVRETPNVAQAHGRAGRSQYHSQLAAKVYSVSVHNECRKEKVYVL
jgi:hypothetical protein